MQFTPYLSFQGQCAEAMETYARIFGGSLSIKRFSDAPHPEGAPPLPEEMKNWVMHSDLQLPDGSALLGADMPPQFGGEPQAGVSITVTLPEEKARETFEQLASGGEVRMPFAATFFSTGFGMCKDRFGTTWMVITDERP